MTVNSRNLVVVRIPGTMQSVKVDLDQVLRRFLAEVLQLAEADTFLRRALAHRQAMSDGRPAPGSVYRTAHPGLVHERDNQVIDSDGWPQVTTPGLQRSPEAQQVRDRINHAACFGYRELAEHPEWRPGVIP